MTEEANAAIAAAAIEPPVLVPDVRATRPRTLARLSPNYERPLAGRAPLFRR